MQFYMWKLVECFQRLQAIMFPSICSYKLGLWLLSAHRQEWVCAYSDIFVKLSLLEWWLGKSEGILDDLCANLTWSLLLSRRRLGGIDLYSPWISQNSTEIFTKTTKRDRKKKIVSQIIREMHLFGFWTGRREINASHIFVDLCR